jgi:hypothetical protein
MSWRWGKAQERRWNRAQTVAALSTVAAAWATEPFTWRDDTQLGTGTDRLVGAIQYSDRDPSWAQDAQQAFQADEAARTAKQ